MTCDVGKATVFLEVELLAIVDELERGVYGVGLKRRERHESMTRRRWCIGVRTLDRISVLHNAPMSVSNVVSRETSA